MTGDIKKIGVLTSGGDCAGLNTAMAAVTKAATQLGWEVFGIHEGTLGLLHRPLDFEKLHPNMFDISLTSKGGSFLGSINKGHPFHYPMPDGTFKDRSLEIVDGYKQLGLDALIGIGGDGSMRIIHQLTSLGKIKFIGIPKTIDNDVACSEYAIGFNTAVEEVSNCIKRLHDTAMSHRRFMVVETMGREVGHIALNAGLAGLADVILIPEIPYNIDVVIKKLIESHKNKHYSILVCSEAITDASGQQSTFSKDGNKIFEGAGNKLAKIIEKITLMETRVNVLGHLQRGGSPSAFDMILANRFGTKAVELLSQGKDGRIVCLSNGQITDLDLASVVSQQKPVDVNGDIVNAARMIGISFGDR